MPDTAQIFSSIPAFPEPPSGNLRNDPPAQPQPTAPTLDSIIATSLLNDKPVNPSISAPSYPISSPQKESAPIPTVTHDEVTPLVEIQEEEKLPTEVESWLQHLDAAGEIKLPEPITHDGEVLLADTEAQIVKAKIILPMTQTGVQLGLKTKVTESARWLAEWCVRLIKMMKDGVRYAPEKSNG